METVAVEYESLLFDVLFSIFYIQVSYCECFRMKIFVICRYQAPQFVEQPKQQYNQQQQPRQSRPYYNAVNEGGPFVWKI